MDFHETSSSLTSHNSELPMSYQTLRHVFNTYSRRSREWRGPYSARIAGRKRKKSIHSEIFRFLPDSEHAAAYLGRALRSLLSFPVLEQGSRQLESTLKSCDAKLDVCKQFFRLARRNSAAGAANVRTKKVAHFI